MKMNYGLRSVSRIGWRTAWSFALVGCLCQLAAAEETANQPTYELVYRFRANAFLHYDVSHENTITTQVSQASETAINKSVTRKHIRVVSVDGSGTAELEPTIDHVQMTVQFDGNDPVEFDSRNPDKQPEQFSSILKTVGKPSVRIRVDRHGRLLKVTRLDRTQSAGENKDAAANDPVPNNVLPFPDKAIAVGHQWEEEFSVPVSLDRTLKKDVRLSRRFQLDAVEDGIAIVTYKTVVLEPVNNPTMRAQLIQRTPTGQFRFDIQAGAIIEMKASLDRTEIGVIGATSSMRAIMSRTEKLIPPDQVAEGRDRTTPQ